MSDVREQVITATYACIARYGMAKTTVDDVARESGVSRATIYRLFDGRDELLRETVGWEMNRFFVRLADAVAGAPDLTRRLEIGLPFAHQAIREHDVLQKVLVTEPDRLLPLLTIEQHRVLGYVHDYLRPLLDDEDRAGRLRPGLDRDEAAEYLARMVLSLIASPGRHDLDDPAAVHDLVRHELLAGIVVD